MIHSRAVSTTWMAHGDNEREVFCKWFETKLERDGRPLLPLEFTEKTKTSKVPVALTTKHRNRILEYGTQCNREPGSLIKEVKAMRDRMDVVICQGKREDNEVVSLSHRWLEMNTRHVSEDWFKRHVTGHMGSGKWIALPLGNATHVSTSKTQSKHTNCEHPIIWPQGPNQSSCHLGNVLNCMHHLGDENGYKAIKRTLDASSDVVTDNFAKFELRNLSCQVKNIKKGDEF